MKLADVTRAYFNFFAQMVGMCDKPAGAAAAAIASAPGGGVVDTSGGLIDVGPDDSTGGDEE